MKARLSGLFCAALLSASTLAHADPIMITSGFVANGDFTVSGDGFTFSGRYSGSSFTCQPCAGGETVTFTLFPEIRFFSGTLDGVSYPDLHTGSVLQRFSVLNLSATLSTTIPADATTETTLTFPFATLPGAVLVGYPLGDPLNPVVDLPLFGFGTGSITLHWDGTLENGTRYFSGQPSFTFASASPAPTPEPSSLLLLGSGLVALIARRRI